MHSIQCYKLLSQLDCLIIDGNSTITSILSLNDDLGKLFFQGNRHFSVFLFEANLSRFIIINDSNSCHCIIASKLLRFSIGIFCVWVVNLNKEIFIWLPVFVILDANFDSRAILTLEFNNAIKWNVILICNGLSIHCFD